MKKQIANIKRNIKDESIRTGFAILGFLIGKGMSKGFDWMATKYPQYEQAIKILKPFIILAHGLTISSAAEDNQKSAKAFGYALSAVGVYEGIKLIPIAKNFFEGDTGVQGFSGNYYMESDKPMLELGQFGINSLPINSLDMESAPETRLELPELDGTENDLEGSEEDYMSGLGYDPDKFEGLL